MADGTAEPLRVWLLLGLAVQFQSKEKNTPANLWLHGASCITFLFFPRIKIQNDF
jgi:hypothetical protein